MTGTTDARKAGLLPPRASPGISDVLLAFGVVAIIGLMILPVPLLVIDSLVAINVLFGVALLLLAIYIPAPTAFASFPSVLLLTTLFRLSLSIAITRLILLDADAGRIIESFGQLVVGGNLVVGVVVFLIITVVQFIVIAKGAERVAEVAARFTLDAMPGKQLSIDSDLRSGLIDKDEARRRRRRLELESQLHGALDGAMKFVRGDSIAGIVIIIINILGGLAIGVLQRGLPLGDAVRTYSILTIGDGLVGQIPALLSAIAAGLVVTRAAGEESNEHLGAVITRELRGHPRVFLIGGMLALLLAGVPGFPWPVFITLGSAMLGVVLWRHRHESEPLRNIMSRMGVPLPPQPSAHAPPSPVKEELEPLPDVVLEVSPQLLDIVGRERVASIAKRAAERLRDEFGAPIPQPSVQVNAELPELSYRLMAFGVRIGQRLIPDPAEVSDPAHALAAELENELHGALRRQLAQFVGIQETANLLNIWSRQYPDLVKELLRASAPQKVSEVLRRLLEEGIPVRHLRDVFEAITEVSGRERDIVLVTEHVRVALRRHITQRHVGADGSVSALIAHPELEDTLRQALRNSGQAGQIAIDPEFPQRVLHEIRALREQVGPRFAQAVLLCSLDIRRHLRKLIEGEFFELPVLSFQDLSADVPVVPIGQIRG
jgi:type III secretion protein V